MNFKDFLKDNIVVLDGGMGTLLQQSGLKAGEYPEYWNLTHPEIITKIHTDYFNSGSNVVSTNTFGANSLKFSDTELEEIIKSAVNNAKVAMRQTSSKKEKFIALDIGPTGKLLKPLGDLEFEDAVSVFAKTVKLGVKYGVDLIFIETMNDSYETKAALVATKENSTLPVMVSNAYGDDGKLMTGAAPETMIAMLEGMGADAIGANCSLGPKQLQNVVTKFVENASVPIILKPNAGLPKVVDGKTVFDVTADEFSEEIAHYVNSGVRVVGGCCGTTPQYIKLSNNKICNLKPMPISPKNITWVSSYTHTVRFNQEPVLIGERINPTGKKRFKTALIENDIDYILTEGINQSEKGVHILDVNVGLPDIDEIKTLKNTVCSLQTVTDLPLQIDTSDFSAMETALRYYNGKAMINSVNGKQSSMDAVFPLVKKYGGLVVALTLDENGIPDTVEGRVAIAEKIIKTASQYGISKNDLVFDTLAMTVSADGNAANVTLKALQRIKHELGCHTVLGVSNISFGLPCRDVVNSTFFALALQSGLSAAIMNPYSAEMMKTYYSYNALKGFDNNCVQYVEKTQNFSISSENSNSMPVAKKDNINFKSELQYAIINGLKDKAYNITKQLLKTTNALEIINNDIIPALNIVGVGFEKKTVYLPQLLMSAESAKSAFEVIKSDFSGNTTKSDKLTFVIATVYGDIHDIGKNIVKLLLENYGFNVIDLGKDVKPEIIVNKVIETHAEIVGLSALMTTTVPAMEETIKLIKQNAAWCKTVVGGAVLTQEYADKIGADKYAKDAMETVRYAENLVKDETK